MLDEVEPPSRLEHPLHLLQGEGHVADGAQDQGDNHSVEGRGRELPEVLAAGLDKKGRGCRVLRYLAGAGAKGELVGSHPEGHYEWEMRQKKPVYLNFSN